MHDIKMPNLGWAKLVGNISLRAPLVGLAQHYPTFIQPISVVSPWPIRGRHPNRRKEEDYTIHTSHYTKLTIHTVKLES
jgi:hypothetical protein